MGDADCLVWVMTLDPEEIVDMAVIRKVFSHRQAERGRSLEVCCNGGKRLWVGDPIVVPSDQEVAGRPQHTPDTANGLIHRGSVIDAIPEHAIQEDKIE